MVPLIHLLMALLLASMLASPATLATETVTEKDAARIPSAARLSVSAQGKSLMFRWVGVNGASYYVLMNNPDGHSGFVPVGKPLPAGATHKTIGVAVHLLDWDSATYFLKACNKIGCSNSKTVGIEELESEAVEVIEPPEGVARFSDAMVLSGDGKTLAVSDPHYAASADANFAGAVFVYRKSRDGWQLEAKLQQPEPLLSDEFGGALSISADGRTLAIGAGQAGTPRMGTAYIFVRSERGWTRQAQVSPSPAQPPDFGGVLFGSALDLSAAGDVLVVGAPFEPLVRGGGVIERAGVVYVFRVSNANRRPTWRLGARITPSKSQADDRFGSGVTLSGNGRRLIALAGEQNDVTETPEGDCGDRINTLYAFSKEGSRWQQEAAIEAPTGSTFFGGSGHNPVEIIHYRALDIDEQGKLFAVGVGRAFDQPHPGEVQIYERDRQSWSLINRLTPPPGREGFGNVLALSPTGQVLAARAQTLDPPGPVVVVLKRSQDQWVERNVLTSPAPQLSSVSPFGHSLALSHGGRTLAVGAAEPSGGFIFVY